MAEMVESEHGKLNAVDQKYTAPRYLAMLVGTLFIALSAIYAMASLKSGDWSWQPFAHDLIKHTFESSSI